jgi:phenylacetic acid degradation operon negative regulatory protein
VTAPIDRLRSVTTSNGAPSARNLLVTLFGDALLPHGPDVQVSVSSMTELLAPFGASERLVRTSLTRLVNDGLLASQPSGRRSFYGVAAGALDLFRRADARIYGSRHTTWDGEWTIVVVDGAEATASQRAELRQRRPRRSSHGWGRSATCS